ncbi:phosphatidate cytidylyltransferase [Compostibacter hankyongensis]|uniref:Phosphatidate cytidylyltransferase n=1 Tax=Compostibacter hankyongensis TaxID=1007089 RepID=A0ABP8G4U0_9BACT
MNTFLTRTGTAVIFVAVMLGGILWSPASFFLLFLVAGTGALLEYLRLGARMGPGLVPGGLLPRLLLALAGAALFLWMSGSHFQAGGRTAGEIGRLAFGILLPLWLLSAALSGRPFRITKLGYPLLGLLYTILPFCMLVQLRLDDPGRIPQIPLGLIGAIWINDTMAYIVGSLIGRTPFFPAISPKKTWEGTIGGIMLTLAAATVFGVLNQRYPAMIWIIIGGLGAVMGTLGDLLESRLKRLAGVKDSGRILPGHGGFLDRFDSLLLATPFVWSFMQLLWY